jgi:subtilase family serine protease
MVLDTAAPEQPLVTYFEFPVADDLIGRFPQSGVLVEDLDGAIYVKSIRIWECNGGQGTGIVKIPVVGPAVMVGCYFSWWTVPSSGSDTREWSGYVGAVPDGDGIPLPEVAAGSGYLYGITEGGGALGGGVIFRVRVASLPTPDLMVTFISSASSAVAPGSSLSLSDVTSNRGPEPAAKSVTSYYFSLTGSHPDVKLNGNRYVPELWPSEDSPGTMAAKVPSVVSPGTYWLLACADSTLAVPERDDSNNCRSAGTAIVVAPPDLVQLSVSNPPTGAVPGSKLTITDSVQNKSQVDALASTTRYYLSLDAAKSADDLLLTGKRAIPILPSGTTSTGDVTLTIPLSARAGTFYLLACADDLLKVKEASESNNCAAASGTMLVGWPDLVTTTVFDPPPAAVIGGQLTVSDTVLNQGTLASDKSYSRYYLSVDQAKGASDILLTGKRAVMILAPGASSTGSKKVTVPLTATAGTYYVIACADDVQKLRESNETNNCRASLTTVTVRNP